MAVVNPTPVPALGTALPDPTDRTTYGARGRAVFDWETGQLVPGINQLAADTYSNALAAEDAALVSVAAANFKGTWSSLTGALNKPASVYHSGTVWALLNNLANVALSQPGVSADWANIGGVKRSGDTMTGPLSVPAGASGAQVPQAQEVAVLASTQLAGNRNRIINGNFVINQRGYVSGTATSGANQYTLDRWRVVTSGQNLTFSASGNGNQVTAPAGGIEQVIEGANIEGGTYVINWNGTATCSVNGTSRIKGESFTLAANTDVTVKFSGGTVAKVQLEPGETPTVFEHRINELQLCQRYYEFGRASSDYAASAAGQYLAYRIPFKVIKRATPTLSYVASGVVNASVYAVDAPLTDSLRCTVASAAGGGVAAVLNWVAVSEL